MPSAKILESKKAKVQELTDAINGAVSGVLVDYRGLTVAEDTVLRAKLREANVEYKVIKITTIGLVVLNILFHQRYIVVNIIQTFKGRMVVEEKIDLLGVVIVIYNIG